ncbi:MAG: hypothetical protein JSU04_18615 [Bdellovibrionales bacterium]|nr:hypothetical protein [Bdellovibrionales bacterium]
MSLPNSRYKYSTYIIAFLDVLGFREMIQENQDEKINQYFKISKTVTARLREIYIKKDIQFISFSDSIVAFMKMDSSKRSQGNQIKTKEFLIALSLLQAELALYNVWLRGGVSVGEMTFNEESRTIFGPGFIRAYDLETKHAKFPRIILDQNIISYLNFDSAHSLIQKINQPTGSWNHRVLFHWRQNLSKFGSFQKDYPLFVDYLSQYFSHENYTKLEVIAHNLNEASQKNPIAYEKFRWVADYLAVSNKMAKAFGPTIEEISNDDLSNKLERF